MIALIMLKIAVAIILIGMVGGAVKQLWWPTFKGETGWSRLGDIVILGFMTGGLCALGAVVLVGGFVWGVLFILCE